MEGLRDYQMNRRHFPGKFLDDTTTVRGMVICKSPEIWDTPLLPLHNVAGVKQGAPHPHPPLIHEVAEVEREVSNVCTGMCGTRRHPWVGLTPAGPCHHPGSKLPRCHGDKMPIPQHFLTPGPCPFLSPFILVGRKALKTITVLSSRA